MTEINYPVAGIFTLIIFCLLIWFIRINQKDKDTLKKTLPGHKLHRKHMKKDKLHT
jgi:hypothetical protein